MTTLPTTAAGPAAAPAAGPRRRGSIGARRNPASEAAILAAAEAILVEDGYAGFTIEAVARRAGAGKPTVYRWWPSKTALLLDVYARQKAGREGPDTGSLAGDLAEFLNELWRFWRETAAGRAFRSIVAEAQADPAALRDLDAFIAGRRAGIEAIFARGRARGEIPAEADVAALAELVAGFSWIRLLTGRIEADPATIAAVVRLVLAGATAGAAAAGPVAPVASP